MATHSDLYPLILPEVPGCPTPTVDSAINRAAYEYCRDSGVWEEAVDPIVLIAGLQQYQLDLPDCSQLIAVKRAVIGTRELSTVQDGRSLLINSGTMGMPQMYGVIGPTDLYVYPIPDAASAGTPVQTHLILAPTIRASILPCVLVNAHAEGVAEGAKAILKRMFDKPWTDLQGASVCHQIFQQRKAEARIGVAHGRVMGGFAVTPRAFGG